MNKENIQYREIQSGQGESDNLEIVSSPELETAAGRLENIKNALDHDRPVSAEAVLQAKAALDEVQIDIEGEKVALKDLAGIPDLKKDLELIKKINAGDNIIVNAQQLSFMTPGIARKMMDAAKKADTNVFILDNLEKMSPETAQIFSGLEGQLWFHKMNQLSPEAAAELNKGKLKGIRLNSVRRFSPEVLEELAKFTGDLSLQSLEELSPDGARAISKRVGELGLPGIKNISEEALTELANHSGFILDLSGLETFNLAMAKTMKKHKGVLNLTGVKALSEETLEELCSHENIALFISYPRDLTPKQATIFTQYTGALGLDDVYSISLETAKILDHRQLRDEVVEILTREKEKGLMFTNLQTMPREAFDLLKDKAAFNDCGIQIKGYLEEDKSKDQLP